MKVLLINPPYPFEENPTPPFGLMSLASYILEKGIEVKIEDYIIQPYSIERVKKILDEYKPQVVGATGVTMNVKKSLSIIKDYKTQNPDIITVIGGPHVTFDAENILRDHEYVDYIVRGEGELTFHEMLDNIEKGRLLDDVLGISYKSKEKIVHNPQRPFIPDINILPFPARHLVQLSKYRAIGFPINMITSRGCPYRCIFCVGSQMVGKRVRYFDVNRVVDEFEMLAGLGFKQINVVDDLFTANKKRCIEICKEIERRGIKHRWNAFARVNTVSKELLEHLKAAGCTTLCFGIESGNQEILDRIKKKITLERCRQAAQLCNEAGVEPMTSYILGLPGETPDTVVDTIEFAKELSPNYGFHILAPFPGTEVRDKCDEYGLKILTDDWDKYDANQSVAETEKVSHEEIDRLVNWFNGSIKERFLDSVSRLRRGEQITQSEADTLEGIVSFDFVKELLLNEIIEKYPGLSNGATEEEFIEDFISFTGKNTYYSPEEIRKRLFRLIDAKCINITREDKLSIQWA